MLRKLRLAVCLLLSLVGWASLYAQTTRSVGPGLAYQTIQSAINASVNGDTVLVYNNVGPGNKPTSYFENIDFNGLAITVTAAPGQSPVIDGSLGGTEVVSFHSGESATSVLNGFTIQNGGNGPQSGSAVIHGGIYISNSSPTISNNTITSNRCTGIFSNGSSPLIEYNEVDSTILDTSSCNSISGIAVYLDGSLGFSNSGSSTTEPPVLLVANTIQGNLLPKSTGAPNYGYSAAVAIEGAYAMLLQNVIRDNTANSLGTVYSQNTDLVIMIGNLIYNNSAEQIGGVNLNPPDSGFGPFVGILENNTIYNNTSTNGASEDPNVPASQVYLYPNSGQYLLINNIIVGTTAGQAALGCSTRSTIDTPLVLDHNDIYAAAGVAYAGACPDQTGTYGNLSQDPLFVNGSNSGTNLQLQNSPVVSPAINAGNNSAPLLPATDIAGNPRIQNSVVDMGAYENTSTVVITPAIITNLTLKPSTYTLATGASLTLTAQLSSANGIPTGPITYYVDLQPAATANTDATGKITFTVTGLSSGVHAFIATYPGQGFFTPAVSVKFYITSPKSTPTVKLTSSSNPAVLGTAVTFTVKVSSPDGSIPSPIALNDAGTLLQTLMPDSTGTATYTTSTLALGTHPMQAVFAGNNSDYAVSSTVLQQQIINGYATTSTLTSTNLSPTVNQSVTFQAQVTPVSSTNGTPTGSFTFTDAGTTIGMEPVNPATGAATPLTVSFATRGTHTVVATFVPLVNFAGSSAQVVETVNGFDTTSVLSVSPSSASYGTPLTLSLAVTPSLATTPGTPSGNATFAIDGTPVTPPSMLTNGSATFTASGLYVGQHTFSCTYDGDSVYSASTCNSVALNVAPVGTTITISSSANPSPATSPINFTAQLLSGTTPVAGAQISVGVNSPTAAGCDFTTNAQGLGSCTMFGFGPGQYTIYASFGGDTSHTASSTSLTQVVTVVPTSTTLLVAPTTASEGSSITLATTVSALAGSSAPAGTVTIFDGATPLLTLPLQAIGTLLSAANGSISTLTVGTHSLYAVYTPLSGGIPTGYGSGPYFSGSQSLMATVVITPLSFDLSTDKPTISIQTEHHGAMTLTVTPVGNFTGYAYLSCTGTLPPVLQCEFAKTPLLVSNAAASTTLTLETDAIPNFWGSLAPQRERSHRREEIALATLLPLALLGLTRKRRKLVTTLAALFLLTFATTLTGCGDKWPDHTPPGTYDIAITATGNTGQRAITSTVHVTLTVTP